MALVAGQRSPYFPAMVEKSYVTQRFAKLKFGQFSVLGYSVGGEETVVQIPELNVCFDVGRCPQFALTSDLMLISHGHMDHVAGIAYYLSQRGFQGMKAGTLMVPRSLERPIDNMLKAWQEVERQVTPYTLLPISAGQDYPVRRDFVIRAVATHHGGPSLGYVLVNVREKLRPEFTALTGEQIAELRRQGVEIQYKLEVPMVAYLGDTSYGEVFDNPDVMTAQVLLCECTFFDPGHKTKAKAGKHLHVDDFVKVLAKSRNEHVVVLHTSRRTGIRRAKHILRKLVPPEQFAKVHFLMDFDDSTSAGDMEDSNEPEQGGE